MVQLIAVLALALVGGIGFLVFLQNRKSKAVLASLNSEHSSHIHLAVYDALVEGSLLIVNKQMHLMHINETAYKTFGWRKRIQGGELAQLPGMRTWSEVIKTKIERGNLNRSTNLYHVASGRSYSTQIQEVSLNEEQSYFAIILKDAAAVPSVDRLNQFAIDEAMDAIMWVREEGDIFNANTTACRLLNGSEEDLKARNIKQIIVDDVFMSWDKLWNISKNCGNCIFELPLSDGDGGVITAELLVRYIDDEFYGPCACIYARNISTRKVEEEQLHIYASELERKNLALEQFANIASHNLQQPLRTISGFAQLLGLRYGDRFDDTANDYIKYVVDGVKHMRSLLVDLATYSEVNRANTSFEGFSLERTLDESIDNLRKLLPEWNAQITSDPLPDIRGCAFEMGQLFQHLMHNAIKYNEQKTPKIHISVNERELFWRIGVSDNGVGFDNEYSDKIFQMFSKLSIEEANGENGNGIGLALCQNIVEKHGGSIWAESAVGEGSTFYFTIPKTIGEQGQVANNTEAFDLIRKRA